MPRQIVRVSKVRSSRHHATISVKSSFYEQMALMRRAAITVFRERGRADANLQGKRIKITAAQWDTNGKIWRLRLKASPLIYPVLAGQKEHVITPRARSGNQALSFEWQRGGNLAPGMTAKLQGGNVVFASVVHPAVAAHDFRGKAAGQLAEEERPKMRGALAVAAQDEIGAIVEGS